MKRAMLSEVTAQQGSAPTVSVAPLFTVDSFNNGIAFGQQKLEPGADVREVLALKLNDDSELARLRSRYLLKRENPFHELELQLMKLSQQGILGRSVIFLGTTTDPFYPFEGKFDASMKFLQLFERYTPGRLVIQTRSPLLVIGLPVLKRLGKRASVTMGVETPIEEVVKRYTPSLPKVSERLQAAQALRKFGIPVTLQVAPLLPYGEWKTDAVKFAELLIQHGDYIYVSPLTAGGDGNVRRVRTTPVAKMLASERRFHWLRPDAANPLISAIEILAPHKLVLPELAPEAAKQMSIFAA